MPIADRLGTSRRTRSTPTISSILNPILMRPYLLSTFPSTNACTLRDVKRSIADSVHALTQALPTTQRYDEAGGWVWRLGVRHGSIGAVNATPDVDTLLFAALAHALAREPTSHPIAVCDLGISLHVVRRSVPLQSIVLEAST